MLQKKIYQNCLINLVVVDTNNIKVHNYFIKNKTYLHE
jgi:hypothetical protein